MQQIPTFIENFIHEPDQARISDLLDALLNRRLPDHARISINIFWPLLFLPVALVNQLLTPHPVWVILFVVLGGVYAISYWWVRTQALRVDLTRVRRGAILIAGDTLTEEFTLHNRSYLPVLWAEMVDHSTLPGYAPGRVAACDANNNTSWKATAQCKQRGVFRLGPQEMLLGDPFGLFSLTVQSSDSQNILIYPRVVQLPPLRRTRGPSTGNDRQRQSFAGVLPSASVRNYTTSDSLRFVHWPSTARRNQLMIKEMEQEPSGDVWIALDLQRALHQGEGADSTLELAIIAAASVTADLLSSSDRRAVGLLAVSGEGEAAQMVHVAPQAGSGHLWRVLAALAPTQACDLSLAEVLQRQRALLGRRHTLVTISPLSVAAGSSPSWLPEVIHLRSQEMSASALLIVPKEGAPAEQAWLTELAAHEIAAQVLPVGAPLKSLLTFRRTRTELRTTPRGGVVVVEVEEEVG